MIHLKFKQSFLTIFLCFVLALHGVYAESALFFGNSFTFAEGDNAVKSFGGVPKILETFATSKGKDFSTKMVTTGGKDWIWHLKNPATDEALKSKAWDWVILQDYSTQATHVGKLDDFFKGGEEFYNRIRQLSPNSKIVLYQTWGYPFSKFPEMDKMYKEIQDNYDKLQNTLASKDSGVTVLISPVGKAFEKSQATNPEINLYSADKKHPSKYGAYLSASVFYALIFQDSPKGLQNKFASFEIEPEQAAKLQAIAEEVALKK